MINQTNPLYVNLEITALSVVFFRLRVREICASVANPPYIPPTFFAIQEWTTRIGTWPIPRPFPGLRILANQTPLPCAFEVSQPSKTFRPLEPERQPEINLVLQTACSGHVPHLGLHELGMHKPSP